MLRRFVGTVALPSLMVLCFFTGTLVGDSSSSPSPKPSPQVESPNVCGTEGDTCPLPLITPLPWDRLPTGHEGN